MKLNKTAIKWKSIIKLTDEVKASGHRPKDLFISAKSWKMLRKIWQLDSKFLPISEEHIWIRAERMNL